MAKVERLQRSGRAIRKGNAVTPKAQLPFGHAHTHTHTYCHDLTDRLKLICQVLGPRASPSNKVLWLLEARPLKTTQIVGELDGRKVAKETENQNTQNKWDSRRCKREQVTNFPTRTRTRGKSLHIKRKIVCFKAKGELSMPPLSRVRESEKRNQEERKTTKNKQEQKENRISVQEKS